MSIRVKDEFDAKLAERIKLFSSNLSLSRSFIPRCSGTIKALAPCS
jgi:hypothetical protein